jgi:hypothetical protein
VALAILALIQVAPLPSLMMRPPERLAIAHTPPQLVCHRANPHLQIADENKLERAISKQACEKWTLTRPLSQSAHELR